MHHITVRRADFFISLHAGFGFRIRSAVNADAHHSSQQIAGVSIADVADSAHIINGFYKAAVVQEPHAVAKIGNGGQVVGNEDVAEIQFMPQILQKVHYLNLRCRIERTNCFIEQNEAGLQSDGAGNAHALELAARKLMRIAGEKAFVETDAFKEFNGFLALSFSADVCTLQAQGAEGFPNNALYAKARIGRSGLILKNNGNARLNARFVDTRQAAVEIEPVETNRAGVGRKQSAEDTSES